MKLRASHFCAGERTSLLGNFLASGTSSCLKSSRASPGSLCISSPERGRSIREWKHTLKQGSTACMPKRFGETCSITVGLKVLFVQWGLLRECCLIVSCAYYECWAMRGNAYLHSSVNCFNCCFQPSLQQAPSPVLSVGHHFRECVHCCKGGGFVKCADWGRTAWVIPTCSFMKRLPCSLSSRWASLKVINTKMKLTSDLCPQKSLLQWWSHICLWNTSACLVWQNLTVGEPTTCRLWWRIPWWH